MISAKEAREQAQVLIDKNQRPIDSYLRWINTRIMGKIERGFTNINGIDLWGGFSACLPNKSTTEKLQQALIDVGYVVYIEKDMISNISW